MRGDHRKALALAVLLFIGTGCQNAARRKVVINEPPLHNSGGTGVVIGDAAVPSRVVVAPSQPASLIDRHPLLSRPRDYYESTDKNKFVKTARAAVIGVPSGIVGELRQIVVGAPTTTVAPVKDY